MKLRPGTPEEVGMYPKRIALIKERAQAWADGDPHTTLAVMAARRGVIVLQEAYGRLSPEPDAPPLQLDSIFPLGSLTKPITSTAVMTLVEDALLGLNRPVIEYIPEFTGPGKEMVLVHHLLSHTSGLCDRDIDLHIIQKTKTADLAQIVDESEIYDTYLKLGYDSPLTCPPGQREYYCQYETELLSEIVKRISGQPLADFAADRIFKPLGMTNSWYIVPETVRDRIVKRPASAPWASADSSDVFSYIWAPAMWQAMHGIETDRFRQTPWACGGVYSTAPDMLRFGQMFLNQGYYDGQQILSPASVATMTRRQNPGIPSWSSLIGREQNSPQSFYAYGWIRAEGEVSYHNGSLFSPQSFQHSGAGGISLCVDPVNELVTVYFSVELKTGAWDLADNNHDLFENAVVAAVID